MTHAHVYLDESEKFHRKSEAGVVLPAVLVPETVARNLEIGLLFAKDHARQLGADVDNPSFEFHASDILGRKGCFSGLDNHSGDLLLNDILDVIRFNELPTVSIHFGNRGRVVNSNLVDHSQRWVEQLHAVGIHDLFHEDSISFTCAGLLFGLINVICNYHELDAKLIPDKQLVRDVTKCERALCSANLLLPIMGRSNFFSKSLQSRQPDWRWRLDNSFMEMDSREAGGLQIADVLASSIRWGMERRRAIRSDRGSSDYKRGAQFMQRLKEGDSLSEIGWQQIGFHGANVFIQLR